MTKTFIKILTLGCTIGLMTASCNQKPSGDATTGADSTKTTTMDTTQMKTDTTAADQVKTQSNEPAKDTITTAIKKSKPLTVVIENLASDTAPVEVSIYSPENKFPSPKDQLKVFRFKPTSNVLTATLPGITYGQYAIAAYQDMDADGKIAKNMIGIPTDPYGFSNNYHPKVKAPAFKDCSFNYDEASNTVRFRMIR